MIFWQLVWQEHVLITIFAHAGGGIKNSTAKGVDTITIIKLPAFFNKVSSLQLTYDVFLFFLNCHIDTWCELLTMPMTTSSIVAWKFVVSVGESLRKLIPWRLPTWRGSKVEILSSNFSRKLLVETMNHQWNNKELHHLWVTDFLNDVFYFVIKFVDFFT